MSKINYYVLIFLRLFGVGRVCEALAVLGPSPAATAFPAVFLVGRLGPASTATSFLLQEFLECAEGSSDEGDLAKQVSLEDCEGDDTQEQGYEGSELQLDEGEDGEELLQLLLLLATAWKIKEKKPF